MLNEKTLLDCVALPCVADPHGARRLFVAARRRVARAFWRCNSYLDACTTGIVLQYGVIELESQGPIVRRSERSPGSDCVKIAPDLSQQGTVLRKGVGPAIVNRFSCTFRPK